MNKKIYSLIGVILLLSGFLAFNIASAENSPQYMGPEMCGTCHQEIYKEWISSGHPWMLTPADKAKEMGIPLPPGISWEDVTYVLGHLWKYRFINTSGYIITWHYEDGVKVPGGNQWNINLGRWVNYHSGDVKKYDCGACHTTGYDPNGSFSNMPGIIGSWVFPGITCERCHGPGGGTDAVVGPHQGTGTPEDVLEDPLFCGQCHIRTSRDNVLAIQSYKTLNEVPQDLLKEMTNIDAKGGMIRHHEQFEEWYNSPHNEAGVTCQTCHSPHSAEPRMSCGDCHTTQKEVFSDSLMGRVGVECTDCHMAKTVKSAEGNPSIYMGDVPSHIFKISLDPDAKLTYKDPETGKEYGSTEIPLGWSCASPGCHGVKGVSVSTAYAIYPKGWNTETAAEVASNIQSQVKKELNTLNSLVSQAESELEDARGMGISESVLSGQAQIIDEAKDLINLIEEDETYGIHNPDLIEKLESYNTQMSMVISLIQQAKGAKEAMDAAASTASDAMAASNTASSAASQSMMVGAVGIILAIIALIIVFIRPKR